MLGNRTTGTSAALLALFASGYFGSMLLLPLYFQVVRGESALVAGALGIPFALAPGATMQVAGRLIDRIPLGRYLPGSIAVALTGFVLFVIQLDADAPYWALAATMLLMGAGDRPGHDRAGPDPRAPAARAPSTRPVSTGPTGTQRQPSIAG
ncbi:hypothetical protein NLM24_32880 [Nocardia zapadnayensis]|uniref:hypothetical protein n=1 Tax=Nocardia rhamnosiphila TaxID=426716 RepID=UPI002246ECB0|nr:hypothetical protein [Nocardia zapadnayensis]MCX0275388.1 hypothetical protein [Nocardia zapadnayensis]